MDLTGTGTSVASPATLGAGAAGSFRQLRWTVESAVADQVGIAVDQLTSQLSGGKSLWDVAAAHGVSRADLVATIGAALRRAGSTSSHRSVPDLTPTANRIADHVSGQHRRAAVVTAGRPVDINLVQRPARWPRTLLGTPMVTTEDRVAAG